MTDQQSLRILYLSAECVPFAKTGGLADVTGALPRAIRARGHDIRVAMPRYGRVDPAKFNLTLLLDAVHVPMDERGEQAVILQGEIGVPPTPTPVYFVESSRYFDRQGIYMYPDDAERFVFFSRAALETCRALDWRPDVVHCNEWHTALVPNWLKTIYNKDAFFAGTASLYTAHNLEYQGIFGQRILEIAGLADMGFIAHPEVAPDLNTVVDFMARGLLFADVINTVSETYAQEILTPEHGQRLDPILRDRRDRLYGILNGIDDELYDPSTDPHIVSHFKRDTLDRRPLNKTALQQEARLPERAEVPLVAMISRLTEQKGLDLVSSMAEVALRQLGVQLIVMGTGEMRYHEALSALAARHPDQAAVFLTFNQPLSQRIFAASDIYLMPSRSEPCGLNQMVAMRYGSVPVVHATGGLADTVTDFRPETGEGHGFTFQPYDPLALYTALVRAVETYRYRGTWERLVCRCMSMDLSWARSAQRYVDLYYRALAIRRQRQHSLEEYALAASAAMPS